MTRRRVWCVYRMFDEDDVLIYVGCTANLPNRLDNHRPKVWWFDVAKVTVAHFADERSARRAEAAAIATEGPLVNVQPSESARRALETRRRNAAKRVRHEGCFPRIVRVQNRTWVLGPTGTTLLADCTN